MFHLRVAIVVTLSWSLSSTLGAQWLHYHTREFHEPRMASPNLARRRGAPLQAGFLEMGEEIGQILQQHRRRSEAR